MEDGETLWAGEQVIGVTRQEVGNYVTVCDKHLSKIAIEQILINPTKDGIDIHSVTQVEEDSVRWLESLTNGLSLDSLRFAEYRFSISHELAKVILPKSLEFILSLEREAQA